MNHIHFTAIAKGAGLAAEIAEGDGRPRVYVVKPLGDFENDPNVVDKTFPGNPTRSYRSTHALKVVSELEDWEKYDTEFIEALRARVEAGMGEIINRAAGRFGSNLPSRQRLRLASVCGISTAAASASRLERASAA